MEKPSLVSRRLFLKATAGAGALAAFRRSAFGQSAFQRTMNLAKFPVGQPMRTFAANSGPNNTSLVVAGADAANPPVTNWWQPNVTHYSIKIGQFSDQLHPSLPNPTQLWGYYQGANAPAGNHLGSTIVTKKGNPVQVSFTNVLPTTPIIPVDTSYFFYDAQANGMNRTAVHLHGGFIPWISDGGPYDWFSADHSGDTPSTPAAAGPSFKNNQVLGPNPAGSWPWYGHTPGTAEYYWGNDQSARLMWYHDHGHDVTRTNAYAGIATGYLIWDDFEALALCGGTNPVLPPITDFTRHIPLIFQDKIFDNNGNLWYPADYLSHWGPREPYSPYSQPPGPPDIDLPSLSCVPEMFGDTPLVNGTAYPFLAVQPKRYRFRILNACNARFMNLQLYVRDNSTDGITLAHYNLEWDPNNPGLKVMAPTNAPGPAMVQIGTECGFLPAPVVLNNPPKPVGFATSPGPTNGNINRYTLLLAPAERADVIIDFSNFGGQHIILYTDCPGPFPGGDPLNDFYPETLISGSPNLASTPGFGPNTRTLMEFQVASGAGETEPFATWLSRLKAAIATRPRSELAPIPTAGANVRTLTLNETADRCGRLIQMLGTNTVQYQTAGATNGFGIPLEEAATEVLAAGATEVWELFNLTADTHPIHFHLVNLQILNRQAFDPIAFGLGTKAMIGPARLPDANEKGWKETIRMNPGEVTRVIAKFDLPTTPFAIPSTDRTKIWYGTGTQGPAPTDKIYHEYVYHCHILEHEEHDMMRPMIVTQPKV